jgi:hypothetical protein
VASWGSCKCRILYIPVSINLSTIDSKKGSNNHHNMKRVQHCGPSYLMVDFRTQLSLLDSRRHPFEPPKIPQTHPIRYIQAIESSHKPVHQNIVDPVPFGRPVCGSDEQPWYRDAGGNKPGEPDEMSVKFENSNVVITARDSSLPHPI